MTWNILCAAALLGIPNSYDSAQREQELSPPKSITIGHPKSPDELPHELLDAYGKGFRRFNIRGGIYRFSRLGHPLIALEGWKRAQIEGAGVTFISQELDAGAALIRLQNCVGVEIDGLTLTQDEPISYQGKMTAVEKSSNGKQTCSWRPDAGYPVPPLGTEKLSGSLVSHQSKLLQKGCNNRMDVSLASTSDGSFSVEFQRPCPLSDGDWLVAPSGVAPAKIHLVGSRECVISEVTLNRNGSSTIIEENGGGNSYIGCHWTAGLKPTGAIEKPLLTSIGKGFESSGAYPGPDIENCEFSGIFLEDCIAIHGTAQTVITANSQSFKVGPGHAGLEVQQPIRITAKNYAFDGFVKALDSKSDGSAMVTLDKETVVPVGATVSNPLRNGTSFKIIHCTVGGTRGRGIVVRADSGLIQNNLIQNCGMSAVVAGPEEGSNESDYLHDLAIDANQFKSNGSSQPNVPALNVSGLGALENHNLVIENNSFEENFGGDIALNWASQVSIQRNSFASPLNQLIGFPQVPILSLGNCKDIRINNNLVKSSANYTHPYLLSGLGVTGLTLGTASFHE